MYSKTASQLVQANVRQAIFHLSGRILKPLVKIFIRYGFSCQEFTELTRWAFVQVAMEDPEFALPSRSRQFKSRAAVLTGLSRKEILRLMEYKDGPAPGSLASANRAARVLDGWVSDRRYSRADNVPRDLPVRGEEGSFHALVREYSGDVPPRAVLDELHRCGAVEKQEDGRLRLVKHRFHVEAGSPEDIELAAMTAGDLLATLESNLRSGGEKRLQREVFNTTIPESALPRVAAFLEDRGDAFAREIESYLMQQGSERGGPKVRAGLGLYRFGA